uniref:YhcH/YjgK/YiaL family protein n=1 Tax=Aliarcobacter sp. TaxID=2321116 RepID=UPI0040475760
MAIFGDIETVKEQINDSKFDKAFLYIKKLQDKNSDEYKSLANIELDECNKIEIDENCFVLEQAYLSKNKEDCFFESHKKYIDIQYIFEGEEIMEVENIKNLAITKEYNSQLDFANYSQTPKSSILKIRENELAIFYPQDAHMPCIKIDNNIKIIKAVFKILVTN